MTELAPISAHQQPAVPLLRRPRPPKTKLVKKESSDTTVSRSRVQTGASSSMREGQHWGASYTDTNNSGSYFTIYPLYPRGPPFLPPGRILKGVYPSGLYKFEDEVALYPEDQVEFALNDFQPNPPEAHYRIVPSGLQGAVISRQNYLKLTSWFAANVPRQESLNTVNIAGECVLESDKSVHGAVIHTYTCTYACTCTYTYKMIYFAHSGDKYNILLIDMVHIHSVCTTRMSYIPPLRYSIG